MKPNSHIIKTCLMKHYRFKRQFICVDEINREPADVFVDTGKEFYEIEIKISKHDLWKGEQVKKKHKVVDHKRLCNKFYICVPTELVSEAEKWIEEVNPKYGLIEFLSINLEEYGYQGWRNYLSFQKRAKKLHQFYKIDKGIKERINMRLCSALVNSYEGIINR